MHGIDYLDCLEYVNTTVNDHICCETVCLAHGICMGVSTLIVTQASGYLMYLWGYELMRVSTEVSYSIKIPHPINSSAQFFPHTADNPMPRSPKPFHILWCHCREHAHEEAYYLSPSILCFTQPHDAFPDCLQKVTKCGTRLALTCSFCRSGYQKTPWSYN